MRWAYSGSMRPEFKVLACEAFRGNFVYCNQRGLLITILRSGQVVVAAVQSARTYVNAALDH